MSIDILRKRVDRMINHVDQRLAVQRNAHLQIYKVILTDEQGNITYESPEEELRPLSAGVARKEYLFDPNDDGSEDQAA